MTKRQEIEKQIKELQEKLEEMTKVREDFEGTFYTPAYGYIEKIKNEDVVENPDIYSNLHIIGMKFKIEKEAEKALEKMILIQEFKDFIEEINDEPIDWKNEEQRKYRLIYEYSEDNFLGYVNKISKECIYYSTNNNFLKLSLERFGIEKLKIIYEVE